MKTQQYYTPPIRRYHFSLTAIVEACKDGSIANKTTAERFEMRRILKANIEAHRGFALKATPLQKASYLNTAKQLTKYLKQIK